MRKLRRPRTTPRSELKSTAAASVFLPPDAAPAASGRLVTGGSRLSEGAIIHATLRARVLGINLLRLEATIEAAPAQLKKVNRLPPSLSSSARPWAEAPPRPRQRALREQGPETRPRQARVIGSRLNEALGFLDEGAASLAAATEHRPRAVAASPHLKATGSG